MPPGDPVRSVHGRHLAQLTPGRADPGEEEPLSLPPSTTTGGGTEMCIRLHDEEALNRLFEEWKARGVGFARPPTTLVFGRSFVALNPDGHRIRAFA